MKLNGGLVAGFPATAAIFIAAWFLLFAGVKHPANAGKPRVLFDTSHGEIFSPFRERPVDYSKLARMLGKSGYDVSGNDRRISADVLKGAHLYVLAGPMAEIPPDEVSALVAYVRGGGNLLVMIHITPPVARLTEAFNIYVTNFVISERENIIDNKSQDFHVVRFSGHPVADGLKSIAVFGAWGLMADGDSSIVATTSDGAWADVNRNRQYDAGEPVQGFGMVAAGLFGKGKIVVIADDAPFANAFLGRDDNRKLAFNILKWFAQEPITL